jgi:hypothetical protein
MTKRNHKRTVGAQPGNQNARKHGFYSNVFTNQDRAVFRKMADVFGLDHEVDALRTKVASIMVHEPENYDLLLRAVSLLHRMEKTAGQLTKRDRRGLKTYLRHYSPDIDGIVPPG